MPEVALVLASSSGGIGRHVASLAAGLTGRGWSVRVLGPADTELRFGFTAAGARFHPVEIGPSPRPLADLRARARLGRLAGGADVVHAHGVRAGLLAALARRRPPLVVSWHNAMLGSARRRALAGALERVVATRSDGTAAASADLLTHLRALGAREPRLVPVAAPPLPVPARDRAEVRAELGAGERPVILAVGRLHPQKGFTDLVAAAGELAGRASPPPLVVIAGDGPQRDRIAAAVRSAHAPVCLLGRRDDVAELLAAADVAVLPSRWEARALVAQEALRAGVPLVATAVGGVPELVGDAALLVPPGRPAELAAALARLLDDPPLRAELGIRGRARADSWPDEGEMLDAVESLYLAVMARRG